MLNVPAVINLSGKMSKLGVTRLSPAVIAAMNEAATNFYELATLTRAVEKEVARIFGAPDCYIAHSAAAAIFQIVAAKQSTLSAQGARRKVRVVLPTSHHIDFGAPLALLIESAGARIIKVGTNAKLTAQDLARAARQRPDLAVFVSSHYVHTKVSVSLATYVQFFANLHIPTLVDAAAEPNVWKFVQCNATYTVISGSKAISGPTTGLVFLAPTEYAPLAALRLGIARIAKVSKENLAGLVVAVSEYSMQPAPTAAEAQIEAYVEQLQAMGWNARVTTEAQREIKRIQITSPRIKALSAHLHAHHIFAREYGLDSGYIEFDLRQVREAEMTFVLDKIREF